MTPDSRHITAPTPLLRLLTLRWLALLIMFVAGFVFPPLLAIEVPASALLAIILALVSANLFSLAWLARSNAPAASGDALLLQLTVDLIAWSFFLYFTGGATNPLISILLPLVAIGATILPARLAWLLAALAIAAYSLLWNFYLPLHIDDEMLAMRWHLAGMWITFALSAAVIVGFLVRLNAALRARDAALVEARAAIERDAQIVALGNLAAGTAHNLGTPLATMRIVIDELLRTETPADTIRGDLELLGAQVENCRKILTRLTAEAGSARAEGGHTATVGQWLQDTVLRWQSQRPGISVALHCDDALTATIVVIDTTLTQALHTLVNNAADAHRVNGRGDDVLVRAQRDDGMLVIEVLDRGAGMTAQQRLEAGFKPRTDAVAGHDGGMGIGLFLARRALERCGGALSFDTRAGGGTVARMTLPLARIALELPDSGAATG